MNTICHLPYSIHIHIVFTCRGLYRMYSVSYSYFEYIRIYSGVTLFEKRRLESGQDMFWVFDNGCLGIYWTFGGQLTHRKDDTNGRRVEHQITTFLMAPNGSMLRIPSWSNSSGHIRTNFKARVVGLMIRPVPIEVCERQKTTLCRIQIYLNTPRLISYYIRIISYSYPGVFIFSQRSWDCIVLVYIWIYSKYIFSYRIFGQH
jgi:hypothetical protein